MKSLETAAAIQVAEKLFYGRLRFLPYQLSLYEWRTVGDGNFLGRAHRVWFCLLVAAAEGELP